MTFPRLKVPLALLVACLCFCQPLHAQKAAFINILNRISGNVSPAEATIKIDGKIASYSDMVKLKDSALLKVEVYQKKQAMKLFGRDEGKEGVITITLRKITTGDQRKENYVYSDNGDSMYCENEAPATLNGDTTQASWVKFLQKNLKADLPIENGSPAGIYYVDFTFLVDTKGTVTGINVPEDPGYGCAAEVIRLMNQSPEWTPGTCDAAIINFKAKQRITFVVSSE